MLMNCGADPAQPTSIHRPITDMTPEYYFCRYIGQTAPHTAFSCGEQVPDVAIPHYRDARMQHSQSR